MKRRDVDGMDHLKLFDTIDLIRSEYERILLDVCNIESPTDYKDGVDRVGAYFIDFAKKRGWTVEVHEEEKAGNAISITMNPDAKGRPIALSGHMDTVHPVGSFGDPPCRIEGSRLYGPGAIDCKGGIVAALLAMDALQRCSYATRPIMLLLQSDEENGSRFSEKRTIGYICEKSKNAEAFLNCEGYANGYHCIERKGILKFEFRVHGKAKHASQCTEGVSAIAEAAHKILKLEELKNADWGITCNCGLISGGTATNTVPEECTFSVDVRVTSDEDIAWIKDYVRKISETSFIKGSRCECELKSYRVAMPLYERNEALLSRMNEIYSMVGLPTVQAKRRGGGSDAADVSAYGIPCVDSVGIHGAGIHTLREYANLPSLSDAAKRIVSVALYL